MQVLSYNEQQEKFMMAHRSDTSASARAGSNDATAFRQHESRFDVERGKARMADGGAKADDVGDLDALAAVDGGQGREFSQHRWNAGLVRREVTAARSLHRRRRHGHRHCRHHDHRHHPGLHGQPKSDQIKSH